jgi:hypothetical protein
MKEVMYDQNSVLIAMLLFITMTVAIAVGNRIGRRLHDGKDEALKTQVNGLQGSLLGILALLLGFTFSQSLQRYDARSAAVVEEANAIGTTYLRADLLPGELAAESRGLLRDYVDLRVRAGMVSLDRQDDRKELQQAAFDLQQRIWRLAVQAAAVSDKPPTINLYLQTVNDMIDSNARRDAALDRHVPELVLFLLYGTFILTGGLIGYAAGVSGSRVSKGSFILVSLIVVLVFIIIDLDRPRRGLIEVNQASLISLAEAVRRE